MIALVLASLVFAPVERDAYGVPHIVADTWGDAFYHAGYATAEDRMWQMENSRRVARGKMSEAFGPDFAASDREILKVGYTDDELQRQVDALPPKIREAFSKYAEGVNAYLASGKLPEGYTKNDLKPEPWTVLDSAAIAVRLFQQFGRGGAGEIRNLALFGYLGTQPAIKGREMDVLEDFAWFNDPTSPTTISPADDPLAKSPPKFYTPDRAATSAHLAKLPKLSLFDLLPGVRLAERAESNRVAETVNAPFKVGSYCIAVQAAKSASGKALLLSGPQMGFTNPSIVHEMSIRAPGIAAVGMDVPGVPGVVIGHTERLAWGLTSGAADTDDVFFGSSSQPIETIARTLKIKGKPDEIVEQRRTSHGPVVLAPRSAPVVFSRKAAAWGRELASMEALYGLYEAKTVAEGDQAGTKATVNFNIFLADVEGNIGYRYAGLVPVRAAGVDPRFPTPVDRDWAGFIPAEQMPHATNPRSGFFANWNNKPVAWWPNGDTPVWGQIFRNQVLLDNLKRPKLATEDLELAIWTAARTDYNYAALAPYLRGLSPELDAFDGRKLDGSISAAAYNAFFDAVREEVFTPSIGGLMTPDNFRQAVQPSILVRALAGKTKFDYLAKRMRADVLTSAWQKAAGKVKAGDRFSAPSIRTIQPPVPYSDRGTYIQIVELLSKPSGRNVLPPGVAETGEHSQDQVPLSRAWTYKPMILR